MPRLRPSASSAAMARCAARRQRQRARPTMAQLSATAHSNPQTTLSQRSRASVGDTSLTIVESASDDGPWSHFAAGQPIQAGPDNMRNDNSRVARRQGRESPDRSKVVKLGNASAIRLTSSSAAADPSATIARQIGASASIPVPSHSPWAHVPTMYAWASLGGDFGRFDEPLDDCEDLSLNALELPQHALAALASGPKWHEFFPHPKLWPNVRFAGRLGIFATSGRGFDCCVGRLRKQPDKFAQVRPRLARGVRVQGGSAARHRSGAARRSKSRLGSARL